MRSGTMEGCN